MVDSLVDETERTIFAATYGGLRLSVTATKIFESPLEGNPNGSRLVDPMGPPGALTSLDLPGLRYRTKKGSDLQAGIWTRLWSESFVKIYTGSIMRSLLFYPRTVTVINISSFWRRLALPGTNRKHLVTENPRIDRSEKNLEE